MAAWEIDTFAYDGVSYLLYANDGNPTNEDLGEDFVFSDDGTKAYFIGRRNDRIYQFALSVAWDLSTISYTGNSFSIAAQNGDPSSIFFSPDGTRLYLMTGASTGTERAWEYSLSTAWSITTASYTTRSYDFSAVEANPRGLFIHPDGTKLWIAGAVADQIHEFAFGTAWNVTTLSHTTSLSVSAQVATCVDVFFKPDGLKLYVLDEGNPSGEEICQYSLSTAWDVSTATYDSKSVAVNIGAPRTCKLSSDGTRLFVFEGNLDLIYQYSLVGGGWSVGSIRF